MPGRDHHEVREHPLLLCLTAEEIRMKEMQRELTLGNHPELSARVLSLQTGSRHFVL